MENNGSTTGATTDARTRDCIRLEHVGKRFGTKEVLRDINLRVPHAQIYGLLGPSGSGKTTMVKVIVGIEVATEGEVYLLDDKMPQLSTMGKIGYMSQSDALYNELTAEENLQFFSSIYGLKGAQQKQRIREVAELVNLTEDLKRTVQVYSGGMRRRLSLATSLLHEPQVLVLDEPTVGIDPVLRKSIWDELRRLSQKGISILVTTHVMDEAEKCDNLAMIRDGRLIATGSPEELKRNTSSATLEEAFLCYGGVAK